MCSFSFSDVIKMCFISNIFSLLKRCVPFVFSRMERCVPNPCVPFVFSRMERCVPNPCVPFVFSRMERCVPNPCVPFVFSRMERYVPNLFSYVDPCVPNVFSLFEWLFHNSGCQFCFLPLDNVCKIVKNVSFSLNGVFHVAKFQLFSLANLQSGSIRNSDTDRQTGVCPPSNMPNSQHAK
jgi:hypothetical protein